MKKQTQSISTKPTTHLFNTVLINPKHQLLVKGGIIIEEIIDS